MWCTHACTHADPAACVHTHTIHTCTCSLQAQARVSKTSTPNAACPGTASFTAAHVCAHTRTIMHARAHTYTYTHHAHTHTSHTHTHTVTHTHARANARTHTHAPSPAGKGVQDVNLKRYLAWLRSGRTEQEEPSKREAAEAAAAGEAHSRIHMTRLPEVWTRVTDCGCGCANCYGSTREGLGRGSKATRRERRDPPQKRN